MNPYLVKSNAQVEILSVTLTLKIPKSYCSQLATESVPHSKIILRKLIGTCRYCPVTNQIIGTCRYCPVTNQIIGTCRYCPVTNQIIGTCRYCPVTNQIIGTCRYCPVTNQIIRYTVLGDFNLDYVKWDNACTSNSVHLKYAYLFEHLCLSQQKPLSFSTIIIKVSLMIWRRLLLIGKTIY